MGFARLADGAERPERMIGGEATLLTRGTHGIEYDPIHDELVLPTPQANAILTFRGGASGEEPPIRVIQGTHGSLSSQIAIDPVHGEIFVPGRSIRVFDRLAEGNAEPIRVIEGPNTRITGGTRGIAVDAELDIIAMTAGAGPRETGPVKILFFNRTDSGNVAPIGEILVPDVPGGPDWPGPGGGRIHQLQLYAPGEWVIAVIPGGDRSWEYGFEPFIGVWSIHDRGAVPPRWKIAGENSTLLRPRGVALMPQSKEIVVADMRQNALLTYFFPEIF